MADSISVNNLTQGDDIIKGGIFFGNLVPAGIFSTQPQNILLSSNQKVVNSKNIQLTLDLIKNKIQKEGQLKENTSDKVYSEEILSNFLLNYTSLAIDYADLKNYIFFGETYLELTYNINFIIENYPYKALIGRKGGNVSGNQQPLSIITNPNNSNQCLIKFLETDVIDKGKIVFSTQGDTKWIETLEDGSVQYNYDVVDRNKNRYKVVGLNNIKTVLNIENIEYNLGDGKLKVILKNEHNFIPTENTIVGNKVLISSISGLNGISGVYDIESAGQVDTTVSPITDPTFGVLNEREFVITVGTISGNYKKDSGVIYSGVIESDTINNTTAIGNGLYTVNRTIRVLNILTELTAGDSINIIGTSAAKQITGLHKILNISTVSGSNGYTDITFENHQLGNSSTYVANKGFLDINLITLTVDIEDINNLIDFTSDNISYNGLLITPSFVKENSFYQTISPLQKQLLSQSTVRNIPWPRITFESNYTEEITNNIDFLSENFSNWVSNPSLLNPQYDQNELSYYPIQDNELNIVSALALDESVTNQFLRRCFPVEMISELNDTEDRFFTRFILLAGKMFDVVKVYIDFLQYTKHLNYTQFNQLSPSAFKLFAEHYGFELPEDNSIDLASRLTLTEPGLSYNNLYQATFNQENNSNELKKMLEEKQKRLLINLLFIYQAKGTQKAIEYLTNLLGSPTGLIVMREFYFDLKTSNKLVENNKVFAPQISYEIDTDYLKDKKTISNPINLPYVYKQVLNNDKDINLREIQIDIDSQNVVENQVLKYGKEKHNYIQFKQGEYCNLQFNNNTSGLNGYFMLPLSFPDKYTGVTVEYMIPRNGFKKNIGNNQQEVVINLASLIGVEPFSFDVSNNPIPLSTSLKKNYYLPLKFAKTFSDQQPFSPELFQVEKSLVGIDINSLGTGTLTIDVKNGLTTVDSFSIDWPTQLSVNTGLLDCYKLTAQNLADEINKSNGKYKAYPYFSSYKPNPSSSFIKEVWSVIIETSTQTGRTISFTASELSTNNQYGSPSNSNMFPSIGVNSASNRFIVTRLEGKDLVIRMKFPFSEDKINNSEIERVAILRDFFKEDGLNHQLRLLYRITGVEVYQDYNFIELLPWLDPRTALGGLYSSLDLEKKEFVNCSALPLEPNMFAFPDKDQSTNNTPNSSKAVLSINNINSSSTLYNNITVETSNGIVLAEVGNILLNNDSANNINYLLNELLTSFNPFIDLELTILSPGVLQFEIFNTNEFNGQKIFVNFDKKIGQNILYTSNNFNFNGVGEDQGENPGVDLLYWWDLLIGLPVGVDFNFKRVAVFDAPSIDHNDSIDFSITSNAFDVEKYSFNFINHNTSQTINQVEVAADYRQSSPKPLLANGSESYIDNYFATNYNNSEIVDLCLTNKTIILNDSNKNILQNKTADAFNFQGSYDVENLFKNNAWMSNVHQSYIYDNYEKIFDNYFTFSSTVATYQSLKKFVDLIKDEYKSLILDFIPIVVNLAGFSEVIRNLSPKKVRYSNVSKNCSSYLFSLEAMVWFDITDGAEGETIKIEVVGNPSDANDLDCGTYVWHESNQATAERIVREFSGLHSETLEPTNYGGSDGCWLFPTVTAHNIGNRVYIMINERDYNQLITPSLLQNRELKLTQSTNFFVKKYSKYFTKQNPSVEVGDFPEGTPVCFEVNYNLPTVEVSTPEQYIYNSGENAVPFYLFNDGENTLPIYIEK